MKRAVDLARSSTGKQVIQGDSLDDQLNQCQAYCDKKGWKVVKSFPLVESGRAKVRAYFEEVMNYCLDPANKIDDLVFKDISRFTREGEREYLNLKEKLEKAGVQLKDIRGIIQPKANTLADLGFEYEWSVYSPSQGQEVLEANRAKDFVRDALSNMIRAEIQYTNRGYWNRRPPYGFQNQKIETEDGLRNVLLEYPPEAAFIKKMFQLKAELTTSGVDISRHLGVTKISLQKLETL